MKQNTKKTSDLVKMSKADMLSHAASLIKGKNLFPKQVEEGKRILQHARIVKR
jgi:hypothetical protein